MANINGWNGKNASIGDNGWGEDNTGDSAASGTRTWQEAAQMAENDAQNKRNAELDSELGQFDGLVKAAEAQRNAHFHDTDVTALALFRNAARSPNGMSDPALNGAAGTVLGIPNFLGMRLVNDGENAGDFEILQAAKNPNGAIGPVPAMRLSPETMNGIAQRLRKNGYDNQDVQAMSNYAWNAQKKRTGWTDSLMAKAGFVRPGSLEIASTTMSGAVANRLRGIPQKRSSISAFGADGKGGWTNYVSNAETGYQLASMDGGTRAVDKNKPSERERIAQINNEARERIADKNNEARASLQKQKGEASGGNGENGDQKPKYDKNLYADLKSHLDSLMYDIDDTTGAKTPREMSDSDKQLAARIKQRMAELLGVSEPIAESQSNDIRQAAAAELQRRREARARQQQQQPIVRGEPAKGVPDKNDGAEGVPDNNDGAGRRNVDGENDDETDGRVGKIEATRKTWDESSARRKAIEDAEKQRRGVGADGKYADQKREKDYQEFLSWVRTQQQSNGRFAGMSDHEVRQMFEQQEEERRNDVIKAKGDSSAASDAVKSSYPGFEIKR